MGARALNGAVEGEDSITLLGTPVEAMEYLGRISICRLIRIMLGGFPGAVPEVEKVPGGDCKRTTLGRGFLNRVTVVGGLGGLDLVASGTGVVLGLVSLVSFVCSLVSGLDFVPCCCSLASSCSSLAISLRNWKYNFVNEHNCIFVINFKGCPSWRTKIFVFTLTHHCHLMLDCCILSLPI